MAPNDVLDTPPTQAVPVGPDGLGIVLATDASVSDDGWLVRELWASAGLDGPVGILQGGFAAGAAAAAARAADPFGAPLTSIDARLLAPTPLGRRLRARVRPGGAVARYQVEIRDQDTLLVSAEVELAGHEVAARAYDLLELATVPLPAATPQHAFPRCFVCGQESQHPLATRLAPGWHDSRSVVVPWVADEALANRDGVVDPVVVAAILDCPAAWTALERLPETGHEFAVLGSYHLRVFRDAPVMEPLRTVARFDDAEGRRLRSRSALVDEDGVTYAVASAVNVAVDALPSPGRARRDV